MKNGRRQWPRAEQGIAHILALLMLMVFTVLAIVLAGVANSELMKGDNYRSALETQGATESGLEFTVYHMRRVRIPANTTQATFLPNLSVALGERLNGTGALGGQSVTYTSEVVTVPNVGLPDSRSFRCWVAWIQDVRCRLMIAGSAHDLERCLIVDLAITPRLPGVFEYGLASRGAISISGSTRIVGVNDPSEGHIFSAAQSETDAISVSGGGVELSGDIFVVGDEASVAITGTPSIGGSDDPTTILEEHTHTDMPPPDFPVLDIGPIAVLATNVLDSSTDMSQPTFENIRIAAGTNPNFNSGVVINGVIYVEAPNIVTFTAGTTINGLIVTQDNDLPIEDCQIKFSGSVETNGVEVLPDEGFAAVKEHTGTFLLAPGFGLKVSGNVGMVSGLIAADQVEFHGTAEGTMSGPIIGLADYTTVMSGNVEIRVDRTQQDPDPAGIVKPLGFDIIPDSYTELPASFLRTSSYTEPTN